MTLFQRSILIWAIMFGLFLLVIIGVNRFGFKIINQLGTTSKYTVAMNFMNNKQYNAAIKPLLDILRVEPKHLESRIKLIEAYRQLGRIREAQGQAETVIGQTYGKEKINGLLILSDIDYEMGQWEKAENTFRQVIQENPNCAEAYYGLANIAEATGDYAEMAVLYKQAAELGTKDSSKAFLADYLDRQQKIETLQKDIQGGKQTALNYYYLGLAYKKSGQWDKTVETFAKAADLPDSPADAYFWLGVHAEISQESPTAISYYKKALALAPNHTQALRNFLRLQTK